MAETNSQNNAEIYFASQSDTLFCKRTRQKRIMQCRVDRMDFPRARNILFVAFHSSTKFILMNFWIGIQVICSFSFRR